jgi:hypothetical protein
MHVDYEFSDPIPMLNNTSNIKKSQPGSEIRRLTMRQSMSCTMLNFSSPDQKFVDSQSSAAPRAVAHVHTCNTHVREITRQELEKFFLYPCEHACDYDCSIQISDSRLAINMHVIMIVQMRFENPKWQSILKMVVDMVSARGLCPQTPTPSAGPDFFTRGSDAHLIPKTPGAQALLQGGLSPVKRSSSRARVPQGLLKPSSRRVKESLKKCSPK